MIPRFRNIPPCASSTTKRGSAEMVTQQAWPGAQRRVRVRGRPHRGRRPEQLLPLRGLAATTHEQYRRTARKLSEGLALEVDSIKQNGTCLFIREGSRMEEALRAAAPALHAQITAAPLPLRPRSLPPPTANRRLRPGSLHHAKIRQPMSIQARFSPGSTAQPDRFWPPAPEPPANIPAATPIAEPSFKNKTHQAY
jgi:hypothetical protein